MRCANCDIPVTTGKYVYEVRGWTRHRNQGGTNALRGQKPTGRILCEECGIYFWATGHMRPLVMEGQESLL